MKLCVCIILHQCFSSGPKGGGGETYQLGESDIYLYIFKGEEKKSNYTKKKKKKICLNAVNSYPECLRKI